ncbi:Mediator of RNA polymerase II transcription subunit 19a [Bienertia sinuspersici]
MDVNHVIEEREECERENGKGKKETEKTDVERYGGDGDDKAWMIDTWQTLDSGYLVKYCQLDPGQCLWVAIALGALQGAKPKTVLSVGRTFTGKKFGRGKLVDWSLLSIIVNFCLHSCLKVKQYRQASSNEDAALDIILHLLLLGVVFGVEFGIRLWWGLVADFGVRLVVEFGLWCCWLGSVVLGFDQWGSNAMEFEELVVLRFKWQLGFGWSCGGRVCVVVGLRSGGVCLWLWWIYYWWEERRKVRGPRELTGAVDLITHYKLLPHHEFFCKKSLPVSIADTHYLHNVVGDTEIRKGEGMQLDQLIQNPSYSLDGNTRLRPFDANVLREAFQLKETTPVELPSEAKGVPTIAGKSKSESKDKERKHKKHKDRDKEKDKEHKKHKHRHKDRSKDKDKKKDKSGHHDSGGEPSKKHHDKKRKHEGDEDVNDIHRHKKSKGNDYDVLIADHVTVVAMQI